MKQRGWKSIVRTFGFGLALGLGLASTSYSQSAESDSAVPTGPTPLHRALWLTKVRPYTPEGRAISAARAVHRDPRAEFVAALAEIHEPAAMPSDLEGDRVVLRLIEIAAERRKAPANFELVFGKQVYLREESRSQRAPALPPDLVRPEFRLVWEDLLLGPLPKGAAPGIEKRALEALAEIGDPQSLLVLEHRFRMTARDGVDPKAVEAEQQELMAALLRFPGDQGTATLLVFVDAALPAEGAAKPATNSGFDVRVRALDMFSGTEEGRIRGSWKTAILAFEAQPTVRPAVAAFMTELKARAANMPVIKN